MYVSSIKISSLDEPILGWAGKRQSNASKVAQIKQTCRFRHISNLYAETLLSLSTLVPMQGKRNWSVESPCEAQQYYRVIMKLTMNTQNYELYKISTNIQIVKENTKRSTTMMNHIIRMYKQK